MAFLSGRVIVSYPIREVIMECVFYADTHIYIYKNERRKVRTARLVTGWSVVLVITVTAGWLTGVRILRAPRRPAHERAWTVVRQVSCRKFTFNYLQFVSYPL